MPWEFVCHCDDVTRVALKPNHLILLTCQKCGRKNDVHPEDWVKKTVDETEFDLERDANKTVAELRGQASTGYFSVYMRFDAARPSDSQMFVRGRATVKANRKRMEGKVIGEKGGRLSGLAVMGKSAHETSGRGVQGQHKQGEEWLHL